MNEEFWTVIGYRWHEIIWKDRWGTPTVHLSRPSFLGKALGFELAVIKVGKSSMKIRHRITCGEEVRWTSTQVLAASDLDKHTSVPWPDEVRAVLEDWVLEE